MKERFLAAKTALLVIVITASNLTMQTANGLGIPVLDASNLPQNILTAMEAISQTAKQIQQYQTQLQQYENQLQNSMAPSAYIWDQAESTIENLVQATNTLQYYQNELGSVDAYLSKFQDASYYQDSPCFSSGGCTAAAQTAMAENRRLASESQKRANDAMFKGLEQQQANLNSDARQLQRLQAGAQGASGQLAAIGYANQLASNQSNQLLQIRSLLITQQNAVATQMQVEADQKSQQEAAAVQVRSGNFVASPARVW